MSEPISLYHRHRFPAEIISHCVWLSYRLPISFRQIEQVMAMWGVFLSDETIRRWCLKCGQTYANALRRRRPRPGDTWHRDDVFLKINGETHSLWRAVDQDGNVLAILVQSRRNARAATRFFRTLLKGLCYVPRVLSTDKRAGDRVAHREMMPRVEHRGSRYVNNRAENSHQPTRQKERAIKKFKSPGHAQRFLAAFSSISCHVRPQRHRLPAPLYQAERAGHIQVWQEITVTTAA